MKIENAFLNNLTSLAKENPRLRQSYDLRTNHYEHSLRMLNAMEPGTMIPIHRHQTTSETMLIVRGKLIERFYNDAGELIEEFIMVPYGECPIIQIEMGQWHSLEVLESGTIIFEAKDGMYVPLGEDDIMKI